MKRLAALFLFIVYISCLLVQTIIAADHQVGGCVYLFDKSELIASVRQHPRLPLSGELSACLAD